MRAGGWSSKVGSSVPTRGTGPERVGLVAVVEPWLGRKRPRILDMEREGVMFAVFLCRADIVMGCDGYLVTGKR